MSSIAKIKANNTEYDVVGLGVENVKNDSFIGTWQGSQQEWEQAEITDWRKWQTDGIVGAGTGYTGEYIRALCHDGEKFCGIKVFSGPQHWMTSTDGVTWTDVGAMDTSFLGNGDACQLTYNNGKYFGASTTYVYSSTDGLTWTQCCTTSYPREIFTNGNLVIVPKRGTSYDYSTDNGATWQTGTWPVDPGSFSTPCIAYNGTTYIAVSREYVYKSTDALTWTYQAAPTTGEAYVKVKYGNGRFVAQMGNYSYYSTDGGTTWTQGDSISPAYALLYVDGVFFAITQSYSTKLISSTDGDDWTNIAPTDQEYIAWYFATSGNGKIIATGGSQGNLVVFPISSSTCYTTTTTPDTTSTVYSAPNTTSALTITSVGTGTITLSDSQVYNRQAGGDTQTYQDVASLYPNHLAFVDNVGVKIGNTLIADNTDTTEIEQDVENLESGKADVDLSNVTDTGTTKIAYNAMPSSTYDTLTFGASNTQYTMPADGYLYISISGTGVQGNTYVALYNTTTIYGVKSDMYRQSTSVNVTQRVMLPVKKGDIIQLTYSMGTTSNIVFRFIYANGSAWEKV
jgi:hypothetical protein